MYTHNSLLYAFIFLSVVQRNRERLARHVARAAEHERRAAVIRARLTVCEKKVCLLCLLFCCSLAH
jgi:hypothetical protein